MNRKLRFFLAGLAGAAAALGHAPFGFWPLSVAGFGALIWLVAGRCSMAAGLSHAALEGSGGAFSLSGAAPRLPEHFATEEVRSRLDRPGLIAWFGGFGYFAVALHWIVEPFLVDAELHGWMAPFALVLLAAGLALFWGLAGWMSARLRWPALGFALALAGLEMLRGHVLTGFPWALPAYIWADTWILGSVAWIGPYGLSLATLVLLALPAVFSRVWPGVLLAVAGGALLAFGGLPPAATSETLGTVRLVQPNAPQDEKWDPERAHVFVDRAIEFTEAEKDGVDLIVWPESAVPYPLDMAAPVLSRAAAAADGPPVITGINRRTETGEWFNALVSVDASGLVSETYDKVHLVPFGEYIPFEIDLLRSMAGFSGFGFTPGAAVRLIETPLGRALPLICYEAIFPGHGREADRPDYLLQITNDAWFGTFSGPYQHLDQARFRAVEQGVPLIRAANTGVSAVIDSAGRVVAGLSLGEAGFLDVAVPAGRSAPTLYARTGDWPSGAAILAGLVALFFAARRNSVAKRAASS